MRVVGLAAVFALVALPSIAQDISGTYEVTGTNLDGTSYRGTAVIAMTSSTCDISWVTGSTESSGICMVSGDTVAVGYSMENAVGLVVYTRGPDGTLSGTWTIDGLEGLGTEVLIPQS